MIPVLVVLAFLSGALPLSVWIGQWAVGADIRLVGDGNPGAANMWRRGGPRWGWLAILKKDAWAVLAGAATQLAAFLILRVAWEWLAVWIGVTAVSIWIHKVELGRK